MNRRHRRWHRVLWPLVGAAALVVLLLAVGVRAAVPRNAVLPAAANEDLR